MARRVSGITIPVKYMTNTKGLKEAESAFGKFGGAVAGIAAAAVTAVAGIGSAAIRMASEFESSFARIEGLVGVSQAELGELEEAAARLGPQFGKSATEAAEALFFITSSGLRGAEAISVLEASLKGSAAGLGAVEPIANAATAAMNTYGSENLTATEAVDALAEAVRLGQFAPEELSGALGRVIPIASELGVSFQETTGLIAALTRGGLSATEAVTGVRGAMQALLKPTGEAATMLQNYGFSTDEVRTMIEEDGLLNTFSTLREAFGENEEDFTRVIGSIEGLNAVLALTGPNGEAASDIVKQMTDDVTVLDEAFGAVAETGEFKFNRAMETAKTAMLPVGETLLDIGSRLLDRLMPTIERFAPMLEEMFVHLEEPLNKLIDALPPLLDAMLPLLPLIGEIAGVIAELVVAAMPIFTALLEALVPILEAIIPPLAEFIVALVEMFAPILVQIIEALTPIIEALLPVLVELFMILAPVILQLIETFMPIIDVLLPIFIELIEILTPLLVWLVEMFGTQLVFAVNGFMLILEALAPLMKFIAEAIARGWYELSKAVVKIINRLGPSIADWANGVIASFNKVIDAINEFRKAADKPLIRKIGTVVFTPVAEPDIPDILLADIPDYMSVVMDTGNTFRNSSYSDAALRRILANEGVPQLAEGGIVTREMLSIVGEAGPEAIIPLDRFDDMGGPTYNITVNAGMGTDGARVGEEIVRAIKQYERRSGPVFVGA